MYKQLSFLIFSLLIFQFSKAQIIDIPDPNFKNLLVNTNCVSNHYSQLQGGSGGGFGNGDRNVDTNNNGEIELSEALTVEYLSIEGIGINSLEGLQHFTNLKGLNCNNTSIEIINVNQNTQLNIFVCVNNNLLEEIYFNNNIDIGYCRLYNPGTDDPCYIEQCSEDFYDYLEYWDEYIFSHTDYYNFALYNLPSLELICVNQSKLEVVECALEAIGSTNVTVSTLCPFSMSNGTFNLQGTVQLDINDNGCGLDAIPFPNLKFDLITSTEAGFIIGDNNGLLDFNLPISNYTIVPALVDLPYYSVSPSNFVVDSSSLNDGDIVTQNFCLIPNGTYNDLDVVLIPLSQPVPGFEISYKLLFKNKGTTTLSGNILLNFENDYMDFTSSDILPTTQLGNEINWSYVDLLPLEEREIIMSFTLNTPTDLNFPLNSGDEIQYNISISPQNEDETPNDNNFQLTETIVNSFDPNDKTCLQGEFIAPNQVGDYLYYRIRFENLGTANATDVIIEDHLNSAFFDINSLELLSSSHNVNVSLGDFGIIEFLFKDIDLPFNDEDNDGYVLYKVKSLATLSIGDVIENSAEIFFDFNAPIITNTYQTTISLSHFDSDNDGVIDSEDLQPLDPFVCRDLDNDGCDDCSITGADSSGGDTNNDGLDTDGDGVCDASDNDIDNDGVDDSEDTDPLNPYVCRDVDGDGCDDCSITGPDVSGGSIINDGQDTDGDLVCDLSDEDIDNDGVINSEDTDPYNAYICGDSDNDGCDDCSVTGADNSGGDPNNDGWDGDGDGFCDFGDADNDGVANVDDIDPLDPYICGDIDNDGCDDCSITGANNSGGDTNNDGPDADGDGICDNSDNDLDNDGVPNSEDSDPLNSFICRDLDNDGCDDCSNTGPDNSGGDTNNDGDDVDNDGICDTTDLDFDNDGVIDNEDNSVFDPYSCRDLDDDGCDDCSITGPNNSGGDTNNDGPDTDGDGICDTGDNDIDNDGVDDAEDLDPQNPFICRDLDNDGCDDCSITGANNSGGDTNNDGPDADGDGICDNSDNDLDNDGVDDGEDTDPLNPYICRDIDNDGCDDCSNTGADNSGGNVNNDGDDVDNDGICDNTDSDWDNDGVVNAEDNDPLNPFACRDLDNDGCDDCSVTGANNSGGDINNDGDDLDGDGICDATDTFNDLLRNNVNLTPNPTRLDITINTKQNYKLQEVYIFDISGNLIYQKEFGEPTQQTLIPVSSYNSGLYFVRAITENGTFNKKFIKL